MGLFGFFILGLVDLYFLCLFREAVLVIRVLCFIKMMELWFYLIRRKYIVANIYAAVCSGSLDHDCHYAQKIRTCMPSKTFISSLFSFQTVPFAKSTKTRCTSRQDRLLSLSSVETSLVADIMPF